MFVCGEKNYISEKAWTSVRVQTQTRTKKKELKTNNRNKTTQKQAQTHLGDPWGFDMGLAVEERFCSIRW